jgi:4-hydroxy-2-oxoheptanedioate aldolase
MTERLNKITALLERGETVFGTFVSVENPQQSIAASDLGFDFVIYDMEHSAFDIGRMRSSMQFLLDRRKIAESGSLQPSTVPLARIPPKAAEPSQWMVKQALDQGVYGVLVPHLETAEQARCLVANCRYATRNSPEGQRGCGPFESARYWGLPWTDYTARADLWPLAPAGELFLMPLVENIAGVRNISEIVQVRGIGAIFFGAGDLSVEMGIVGQFGHPELERALATVRAACRDAGIACAVIASPSDVVRRLDEGFEIIITMPVPNDPALSAARDHLRGKG